MSRIYTKIPAVERFWAKVNKTETCWLWTAGKSGAGYGMFHPASGECVLAHRWAYEAVVGPIPTGLQIDHLCRVRHCVNPAHLEPVTAQVNNLRSNAPSARRAKQTHCKRGHEFTHENTYRTKRGQRSCRTCHRDRERARLAALRSICDGHEVLRADVQTCEHGASLCETCRDESACRYCATEGMTRGWRLS